MKLLLYLTIINIIISLQFISCHEHKFIKRTDKSVDVDVSPFFKMHLNHKFFGNGVKLDINVLSNLVKIEYAHKPGDKPKVNVKVFGIGGGDNIDAGIEKVFGEGKGNPIDDLIGIGVLGGAAIGGGEKEKMESTIVPAAAAAAAIPIVGPMISEGIKAVTKKDIDC